MLFRKTSALSYMRMRTNNKMHRIMVPGRNGIQQQHFVGRLINIELNQLFFMVSVSESKRWYIFIYINSTRETRIHYAIKDLVLLQITYSGNYIDTKLINDH